MPPNLHSFITKICRKKNGKMCDVRVPFGVHELVEFAAVGLHHAFTACQDVDLTCSKGIEQLACGVSHPRTCAS